MNTNSATWIGIGCGVAAGALWGAVFLAPVLVPDFSPLQLAAGRYLAYGAIAAILVAPRLKTLLAAIGPAEWWALARLSVLGNILYYLLLASAVQLGGVAMTSLVIGLMPVAVTIIGSRDHGAVPLRRLGPSLVVGAAGIACIGWQALASDDAIPRAAPGLGLLCAAGALASWTAYAVKNSRWLARLGHVSVHDWNLLTGVVTGGQALVLAVPAFAFGGEAHVPEIWLAFVGVVSGVAIFASILGNAFWNRASRLLPLTLVGQMILFETLFALLYGFLWERRLPTLPETAAMVFVVASVALCVSAHRRR